MTSTPAPRPGRAASRTTLAFCAGLLALMLLVAGSMLVFQARYGSRADPIGGAFAMTDMTGRPVTDADLRGKPSVLFFGFTYCPDTCPTTLLTLTEAMQAMGPAADKLNVVFVTVDPERDTPAQLQQYLSSFDPRIRGLTGTPTQLAAMARNYKVLYRRVPTASQGYTMDHSAALYLFNAAGRYSGAIPPGADEAAVVSRLRTLALS